MQMVEKSQVSHGFNHTESLPFDQIKIIPLFVEKGQFFSVSMKPVNQGA